MGLIILIVVGAILGWLATIVLRIEDERGILTNVVAGILGSLVAGLIASGGTFFSAVSAIALLWAVAGSVVAIAAICLLRQRAFR